MNSNHTNLYRENMRNQPKMSMNYSEQGIRNGGNFTPNLSSVIDEKLLILTILKNPRQEYFDKKWQSLPADW